MKIRTGFVSNSSSSSFCVVITEERFQEAKKKCSDFVQYMLDHKNGIQHKKFAGRDIVIANGFVGEMADYEGELIKQYINHKDDQCVCPHCGRGDSEEIDEDSLYDEASNWIYKFIEAAEGVCGKDELIHESESC